MKNISKGGTYTQLKHAYEYYEIAESKNIKEAANSVVKALLKLHNDECSDSEDEITESELKFLFGDED